MTTYDDDEAPLDPAAERLRRKLVRLLFVSGGIMMLGLIAVFAAIVYKVGTPGSEEGGPTAFERAAEGIPVEANVALPSGARVVGSALDGDRMLLTVESADGATALLLVDLATGQVIGRYAIVPE